MSVNPFNTASYHYRRLNGKVYRLKNNDIKKPAPISKALDKSHHDLVDWLYDKEFTAFTTFTTQKPIALPATRRLAERFRNRFHAGNNHLNPNGDKCDCPGVIDFFWCAEPFDTREGFHFHGLIKEGIYYSEEDYRRYWEEKKFYKDLTGRIHVSMNYGRFDYQLISRNKNIEYYVTKYITKKLSDYDYYFRKPLYHT